MMSRRRFLTITSASLATGVYGAPVTRWHGHALGAEVSFAVEGPHETTKPAIAEALATIDHIEHLFSLYRPTSDLVKLNSTGRLDNPHPDMLALFEQVCRIHAKTEGLFDPTVQTLWQAAHAGRRPDHSTVDWSRVTYHATAVRLGEGQQITLNGIAQGFATDRIAQIMRSAGPGEMHINIGEQIAQGRPRRLGLIDPTHGDLGQVTLRNAAIATSSPGATPVGQYGHIFAPTGQAPLWSTVSVIADTATLADGLSTALCLADDRQMKNARRMAGVHRIIRVDNAGDLTSL